MKLTIKTTELELGDFVVGYNKIVANVWRSGFDGGVVITFADGSEVLTMKSWEMTVMREELPELQGDADYERPCSNCQRTWKNSDLIKIAGLGYLCADLFCTDYSARYAEIHYDESRESIPYAVLLADRQINGRVSGKPDGHYFTNYDSARYFATTNAPEILFDCGRAPEKPSQPTISNWKEASEAVRAFAAQYGVTAIYWGTGYPITKPHAVASTLDALSGEGMGYFVRVYPEGDHGYMSKAPYHSTIIRIK